MGKKNKKGSKKLDGEFFESLVKAKTDEDAGGGWQTGPASTAMRVDEEAAGTSTGQQGQREGAATTSGVAAAGAPSSMQLDSKPGRKKRLGVAVATLKRGQRTKAQRLRKAQQLDKAMARVDKVGVRLAGEQTNKVRKLSLKHMY